MEKEVLTWMEQLAKIQGSCVKCEGVKLEDIGLTKLYRELVQSNHRLRAI